jgi:hypothetical protein
MMLMVSPVAAEAGSLPSFADSAVELRTDHVLEVASRQRQARSISQIPRSVQAAIAPKVNALAVRNGGSPTAQLDDAEANLACAGDYVMVTWDEDENGKPVPGTTVLHCEDGRQIPVD